MFGFLKENSDSIIKLFVNQLGMTIFGLLLSFATLSNKTLLAVTGIFSILFYLFLLYSSAWETGAKDKIKVDGKRAVAFPLKGLFLSIAANAINILLALLMNIGYFLGNVFELKWAANLT